jgi:RNA polymerase sigma-70 factor (ECF subfamily)
MGPATEQSDETEIMRCVQQGRGDLVGLLFDRHHGPVYGFFVNLTRDSHLSEDLTQEVFLRVLRYAGSFKDGAPFRPWLYRIARNVVQDHWSRQRPTADLRGLEILPDTHPTAQELALTASDHARLQRALDRLPAEKRELLLLSRNEAFTSQDLAGLFGCSPSAVKVRVHRALKDLRDAFFQPVEVSQ